MKIIMLETSLKSFMKIMEISWNPGKNAVFLLFVKNLNKKGGNGKCFSFVSLF